MWGIVGFSLFLGSLRIAETVQAAQIHVTLSLYDDNEYDELLPILLATNCEVLLAFLFVLKAGDSHLPG